MAEQAGGWMGKMDGEQNRMEKGGYIAMGEQRGKLDGLISYQSNSIQQE